MSYQQEFEFDGDWTEKFIKTIQVRPAIYDGSLPEHSDRNLISRLWAEVCQEMIPSWQNMTSSEKVVKEKELQNRWRNLRTCFRREINKQRQEKSSKGFTKRRKYIYYDLLLFLLPTLEDSFTISESTSCIKQKGDTIISHEDIHYDEDLEKTEDYSETLMKVDPLEIDNASIQEIISQKNEQSPRIVKSPIHEESFMNISREKKEEEIDEDKYFLLSLVPAFKKLRDDQKFEAKMDFLATLKRLTQQRQEKK